MITPEQREQIHALRALGWSQQAIAEKVGCAQTTVCRYVNPAVRERDRLYTHGRYVADPVSYRAVTAAQTRKTRDRIADIKLAAGCMDCGFRGHHVALDFDHRPGVVKSFNISDLGHKWTDIEAEIAKCDVVCANCHRIRTYERGNQ